MQSVNRTKVYVGTGAVGGGAVEISVVVDVVSLEVSLIASHGKRLFSSTL